MRLTRDAWLSERMGKHVYHLRFPPGHRGNGIAEALAPVHAAGLPAMVYAKIAVRETGLCQRLQQAGFAVVVGSLFFELRPAVLSLSAKSRAKARFARPEDEERIRHLARRSFSASRFHLDPQISDETANGIKAEWAGNFFAGKRGDYMVVVEGQDGPSGFLLLLEDDEGGMTVDLLAVDTASRRKGLASEMIRFACAELRPKAVKAGTQTANPASIGLYQGLGFRLVGGDFVLHNHIDFP